MLIPAWGKVDARKLCLYSGLPILPCAWQSWQRTWLLRERTGFQPRSAQFFPFSIFDVLDSSRAFSVGTIHSGSEISQPNTRIKAALLRCFGAAALPPSTQDAGTILFKLDGTSLPHLTFIFSFRPVYPFPFVTILTRHHVWTYWRPDIKNSDNW